MGNKSPPSGIKAPRSGVASQRYQPDWSLHDLLTRTASSVQAARAIEKETWLHLRHSRECVVSSHDTLVRSATFLARLDQFLGGHDRSQP